MWHIFGWGSYITAKNFENFVINSFFLFLQPLPHLRHAKFLAEAETSIEGTVIKYLSCLQNNIIRRLRVSCQGTKDFVAWQKNVGLHVWSWATVEKILVGEKKSFALEMASCWQIFLENKQNYAQCEQDLRWGKQGLTWDLFRHEWVDTFKY